MKRAALLSLLVVGAGFSQTPMNLVGWGRENTPVDGPSRGMGDAGAALRSDRAWDPLLVARSSFNTLTALEAQIVPQLVWTDDGTTSNTLGGVDVPRLSLGIPLGSFGHLSGGYWQRFSRSFESRDMHDTGFVLTGEGGSFEAVAGYAYALPFDATRGLAFGLGYHRVLGRDRVFSKQTWKSPDEYLTLKLYDTVETRRDGSYWTLSSYWTRGAVDIGGWYSLPGDVELTRHRGASDQRFGGDVTETVDAPVGWGVAGAWRFLDKQTLVARLARETWEETIDGADPVWAMGAGWQWQGSGDRFDRLWKRSAFRVGGLANLGGPGDITTLGATFGTGLPLGSYGTLDLSTQVGRTTSDVTDGLLDDSFLRFYVTLTGANRWGQSQRKRR
jgi:hypothetical protein